MGDYKINIVNLNVTNNYVELTAELEGDKELYYPRISACFYGENDNRILPMDLKSCNKNKAIAIGIFDTPFLFYNNRKSQNVRVNFLFSDGNGESIIVKPEKELIIPIKKKNILSHFFSSSKRERSKMIVTAFKLYATSSVVFVDDYYHFLSYLKKKDDVKLIQLWHACGAFKTFGFSRLGRDSYLRQSSPNHRQYDYVIVSSNEVIPYYAEGFGVSMDKVIALGSPRCDVLEDENYKKRFKKRFYKENPEFKGKKILLFAPTFRGGGMGNCFYPIEKFEVDKIFDKISDDWVIAVKMHPYLSERPTCSAKYKDRLIDLTSKYDVNDLLFVSDLLITDYSSVIFEASIVNVPMLFFAFDLNEYSRDRDFYCNFASFVPGKIVLNTDEMTDSINNEDYNQELVKPFRQRYFGDKTGEATKNVVEFTKELLDNNV